MVAATPEPHKSPLPSKYSTAHVIPYDPAVDACLRGARLTATQNSLTRSDLWFEFSLLDKLLYKSKHQHKASTHFHKLQEVKRSLKLLRALQLTDLIGNLVKLTASPSVGVSSSAAIVMYSSANKLQVPCKQAGVLVMQRIMAACRLAVQMMPAVHAGAAQLLAQLGMTYFMPFCLTALAMLARIQVLVSQLLLDCIKAYNSLMPLVVMLPHEGAPRQPAGKQYADLPHMLSCTWEAGLPRLHTLPFTDHADFTAATMAFAQHRMTDRLSTHPSQPLTTRCALDAEDMGEKISRGSMSSVPDQATHASRHPDDVGHKGIGAENSISSTTASLHQQAQPDRAALLDADFPTVQRRLQQPTQVSAAGQSNKQQVSKLMHPSGGHPIDQASSAVNMVSEDIAQTQPGRRSMEDAVQRLHPGTSAAVAGPNLHPDTARLDAGSHGGMAGNLTRHTPPSSTQGASGDLLVFEDRAAAPSQQDIPQQQPRYKHSLPAVSLGRQAPQATTSSLTQASSQRQSVPQSRKRSRPFDLPTAGATMPALEGAQVGRLGAQDSSFDGSRRHHTMSATALPGPAATFRAHSAAEAADATGDLVSSHRDLSARATQSKVAATRQAAAAAAAAAANRPAGQATTSATAASTAAAAQMPVAGPSREAGSAPSAAGKMPTGKAGHLRQPPGPAFIRVGDPQPIKKVRAGPPTALAHLPRAKTIADGRPDLKPQPGQAQSKRATGAHNQLNPDQTSQLSMTPPKFVAPTQASGLPVIPPQQPQAPSMLESDSPVITHTGTEQTANTLQRPTAMSTGVTQSGLYMSTEVRDDDRIRQIPAATLASAAKSLGAVDGDTRETPAANVQATSSAYELSNVTGGRPSTAEQRTVSSEAPLLLQSQGCRKTKKQRLSKTPESRSDTAWQELLNLDQGSPAEPVVAGGRSATASGTNLNMSMPTAASVSTSSDILNMLLGKR